MILAKVLLLAAVFPCAFCLQALHDTQISLTCSGNGSNYACQDDHGQNMGTLSRQRDFLHFSEPDAILDICI